MVWLYSKDGQFSVKSAYFPSFKTLHGVDGGLDVWRLNLPPKLLHLVQEALVRRGLVVTMTCPVCGKGVETIKHLFSTCKADQVCSGFNFQVSCLCAGFAWP